MDRLGTTPVSEADTGPDRTWLVAVTAALWGTDALLRLPLAGALPASTIVFWEHLIIMVVLVPFLPAASRAFRAASVRDRLALVVIGAGRRRSRPRCSPRRSGSATRSPRWCVSVTALGLRERGDRPVVVGR